MSTVSLGLDSARLTDAARYPISGRTPRLALRPATRDELAEALRAAAADRLAVVPWGAGTALAREPTPPRYDVALDLTALDGVVEYDPEDLTLTAECGATVAALRAALAARGQELPLECPSATRATLGGVLAANASGPRRLRFGAPRDRILGARFALADGTIVRSGGKVVKNVAGYGIHRLLCGSRGGLAILVEASLKLMPAPATRLALVFGATAGQIGDTARWARFARLEPALLSVVGVEAARSLPARAQARFTVVIGLEDDADWVGRQADQCVTALGAPEARIAGAEAEAMWQALADLEAEEGACLTFTTAGNTPASLAPLLDHPAAARAVLHAPAGRLHLFPAAGQAQALVDSLAAAGFTLIAAEGAGDLAAPLPAQEAVLALRRRIREALDPARTLALGGRWETGGTGR